MFSFGELLSGGSYLLTGLSVANGLTAALVLVIGIGILLKGKAAPPAIAFFIVAAAAAAWLVCFAMMFASPTPELAIAWARAGLVPIGVIGAATLHFTIRNVRPVQRRTLVVICWIALPLIGAVGAGYPVFINGVRYHSWGYYPVATALTALLAGIFFGAMLPATFLLWRASRRSHGPAQESAHALTLASILGLFAFVDYLPAAGVDIYPVGYMAIFAFAIVGGSALWRYHLIDLTPEYAAAQILETMKSAVLLVDMDARIRLANRGACVLLGYTAGELIGQPLRKILDPEREISTGKLLNSSGVLEQTMVWLAASGARIDVLASSSFVRDADGAPLGVVYVASDYTERRRADEALRESELRYRTLFDHNPLPMWVYDFESLQFIAVNDEALRHYGYSRDEFLSMKITDIRPEEDVPAVLALLPQLPARVSPAIFRHKKKDGSIIDVDISSFEFVSGGRRRRLVMASDITERRRSERLLRESEARYRLLFERNLAGVYRTTADGRVLDANDAFARVFGYNSREELLSVQASSFYFDHSERERTIAELRQQRALTNVEVRMRRRDGSAVWVLENMTMIEGTMPEILEGTIIDITDRKYAQEEIEYQAYHDVLTGLPNRLLFRDRISVALAHARRVARAVAVMFFDLDDFKNVNDSLGHTVGDRLLQSVGMRLVAAVRAEDTVARMGGDEFTVLLSDVADGRGAATVAKKILDSISAPVVIDGHELKVTTSIGIAVFP
ncbi:MAG: PAS domain S-box protein, partial [Thermoanaerobaculia bacterium]